MTGLAAAGHQRAVGLTSRPLASFMPNPEVGIGRQGVLPLTACVVALFHLEHFPLSGARLYGGSIYDEFELLFVYADSGIL